MPRIKTISYSALFNLGDYSNERVGFSAVLEDGESIEDAINYLRQKAKDCALPNRNNVINQITDKLSDLREIEFKIQKKTREWNAIAEFLRKQGINTDAINMPMFENLLPQSEHETVINGELEDEDYRSDGDF